jgi:hypothetical protein
VPRRRHSSGNDRDSTLAFLIHPIGNRSSIIHIAESMSSTGVKEHTLGRRRLPGINMCDDADIPVSL